MTVWRPSTRSAENSCGIRQGIVKLAKSESIDPQDTGPEPVVNPPCWASETVVSLNLTVTMPAP